MQRRALITLLASAAALPFAATAQQPDRIRRIGAFAGIEEDAEGQARFAAFLQGLRQLGWTDGRNVRIDYRWGPVNVRDAGEIERAIAAFARHSNGGSIVTASALAVVHRDLIVTLAARHKPPAVFYERCSNLSPTGSIKPAESQNC
jgi:hypothetical protein